MLRIWFSGFTDVHLPDDHQVSTHQYQMCDCSYRAEFIISVSRPLGFAFNVKNAHEHLSVTGSCNRQEDSDEVQL